MIPENSGLVFDIRRFSVQDGPGIRTTVFFKGCPLRCDWCHNPESQSTQPQLQLRPERCIGCGACLAACPQGALALADGRVLARNGLCTACGACIPGCYAEALEMAGRTMTVGAAMAEVERDVVFYDRSGGGVTFSGGEPLAQPGFLLALLQACRRKAIHTALDTSGHASWAVIDALRLHVDLFLYDLKLVDDDQHRQLTGVSNRLILANLAALAGRGHRIILRMPVIPGVNDDDSNVEAAGALAASLPGIERLDLLPYHGSAIGKYERMHRPYPYAGIRSPSPAQMEELAARLAAMGAPAAPGG
jgi:pyruvate formate lyase activating enzyme